MTPTLDQLKIILPLCEAPAAWLPHLQAASIQYDIGSPQRWAAFLAQVGHESSHLNRVSENLNYSAPGLLKVFGKYFPDLATATAYEHQKERIANRVYANRLGNGPEASGDGWRYRGRGLIQLTGRSNYREAAVKLKLPLEARPELLEDHPDAALSAGWFWQSHGLNPLADHSPGADDDEDFRRITGTINSKLLGLDERRAIWVRARRVFNV